MKYKPTSNPDDTAISEADRHAAKLELRRSLGVTAEELIDDLPALLREKIKEIPRYKKVMDKLQNSKSDNLVYDLFKMIRQSADGDEYPSTSGDGVRMDTMKEGRLACAGRTLFGATALGELAINHMIISAPKHSLLMAEIDDDTLAYIDPMQNLYFTMPKSAIDFKGFDTVAEYTIGDFKPRDKDTFDGLSPAYRHFLALPADMGISNQYLMNIGAALNGNPEFNGNDTCPSPHEGGARAATEMAHELCGEKYELTKLYSGKMEKAAIAHDAESDTTERIVQELIKESTSEDNFVYIAEVALNGKLGDVVPYLKNAKNKAKEAALRQFYKWVSNEQHG